MARWPLAVSIVATLGILLTAATVILDLRAQVKARAEETAENLRHVIAQDVLRNIEVLDLSLQAVVDGLRQPEVQSLSPELRQLVLFDRSATATSLGSLVVFDETGRLTIDSLFPTPRTIGPATEQEFFQAQRDFDLGLFISRPYRSRLIGTDVIGLSRRITKPDGAFGGVVLAMIQLRYFDDLLSKLKLGEGAVVSLVRLDGAVLVRHAPTGFGLRADLANSSTFRRMRDVPSGTFTAISGLDGVERQYSFTRLGGLPLVLSVGLSTESVYAEWNLEAIVVAVTLGVICIAIIALTLLLTRELGRRSAAESALVELNEELARLSSTDALTDLGNRRAFDGEIARELRRSSRCGQPLSLLVLDVDHFKAFNDTYGHQEGDAALRAIAGALRESARRPGDVAYRVGGEEFAIILADTDLAGASAQAEHVRHRVRELAIPHAQAPSRLVTVSVGATEAGTDGPSAAFARADAALYAAKRQGRDGVVTLKSSGTAHA